MDWEIRSDIIDYVTDKILDQWGEDTPIYIQGNQDIYITFGNYTIRINIYNNMVYFYQLNRMHYIKRYTYKTLNQLFDIIDHIFNLFGPPLSDF